MYHHRKKLGIAISLLYIIQDIFCSGNNCGIILEDAVVAQLAEQLIRNEQVAGSIPVNGSISSLNSFRQEGYFFIVREI